MRKLFLIFTFVASVSFDMQADSCARFKETVSDSLWFQWFSPEYDNSVEISEMRNEYLFCRLASVDCCSFLLFLSNSIGDTTLLKIEKELQSPLHDDIDIETCAQNILSCPVIENNFKTWLIDKIKQPTKYQSSFVFQSIDPIANFTWDENDTLRYNGHYLYESAYQQIAAMLNDTRPIDFGEAVFAVENCLFDGKIDHSWYIAEINRITNGIQQMASSHAMSAPSRDVALNYAIFIFYTQPCSLNSYKPYEYDQASLMKDAGLTGGQITNLLKTGKGTCHSLPYLYKIIADRVGAKAYIAVAPLHCYIRHQDAEGKWWNFETTAGSFSRSSYIMESFHINENGIKSGLYMTNLAAKETIVQCLYDLLCIYKHKTGFYSNDFVRKCYTLGLKYHYADNLHTFKINDLKYQLDKEAWNKGLRSESEVRRDPVLGKEYDYLQQLRREFEEMGYHAFTTEEYSRKYQEALEYLQNRKQTKY